MFDGANAQVKRSCVNVISGDGCLDGVWVHGNARWCLVCGVWICVAICGVDDVMYSGGKVWNGDGRCLEMYGSVGCGGARAVPGAVVIKVLDRREG